ncbi:AlbA family DNA-binding domain-containing protein [Olivibacter sitiensis]|uniref:AlbA family DNA-binding domain-containing protein n=1 Tax=Olivibacter sitiensis TaxID=376470 RepID=UPI00041FB564|nr:ATP-binding protein [Olivibacter sitiensis]
MNIKHLILQGEGERLDFKNKISSEVKIAKTLVAFANNKGGRLLVGIADDGTIRGVKNEEEERYTLNKAATLYCKPIVDIRFEEAFVDDKVVLIAEVSESDTKPHFALDEQKKWWVYIRIKDRSQLAGKVVVDVLKRSSLPDGVFISYSEKEKNMLEYIQTQEKVLLLDLCKHMKLSRRKTQKILVDLILAGLIKVSMSEKGEYYSAMPEAV